MNKFNGAGTWFTGSCGSGGCNIPIHEQILPRGIVVIKTTA